jgi:hypothetical protein
MLNVFRAFCCGTMGYGPLGMSQSCDGMVIKNHGKFSRSHYYIFQYFSA